MAAVLWPDNVFLPAHAIERSNAGSSSSSSSSGSSAYALCTYKPIRVSRVRHTAGQKTKQNVSFCDTSFLNSPSDVIQQQRPQQRPQQQPHQHEQHQHQTTYAVAEKANLARSPQSAARRCLTVAERLGARVCVPLIVNSYEI